MRINNYLNKSYYCWGMAVCVLAKMQGRSVWYTKT